METTYLADRLVRKSMSGVPNEWGADCAEVLGCRVAVMDNGAVGLVDGREGGL